MKDNKLKDLSKIQQRTSDLKSKIIDSEAFSKYLLHKEMNKHRQRGRMNANNLLINNIIKDADKMKTEDEKAIIFERFQKLKELLEVKPGVNIELQEFKRNYYEDIKKIEKMKGEENKLKLQKEIDELLVQKVEIELEIKRIEEKQKSHDTQDEPGAYEWVLLIYPKLK